MSVRCAMIDEDWAVCVAMMVPKLLEVLDMCEVFFYLFVQANSR